jgi:signal transduction histidine kinase
MASPADSDPPAPSVVPSEAAPPAGEEDARRRAHLLGALSHELRTPLQTISSWAKTLAARRDDTEAVGRAADAIERAVRQAVRTLDGLVDAERLASGLTRLEPSPLDLAAFVRQQIDASLFLAAQKQIAIESELSGPLPVRADPARLDRVVASLIANAIRCTPAGGRIRVSTQASDGEARLAVRDGGPAVPPEALPHFFDHVARSASSARPARAAPFELVVAKGLVELHGGRMAAVCDDGGAQMVVALPLAIA